MTGLRRFAGTSRRLWWLFVVCVVVGLGLSAAFSAAKKTDYTASIQVLVQSTANSETAVADAQLVAKSDGFYRQVASSLRTDYKELQQALSVSNPTGTNAIQFSITAPTEKVAISEANTVASQFNSYYGAFVTSTEGATTAPSSRTVSPALTATPSAPSVPRNLAIGVVAGLIIAVLIVGLLEGLDRTIRFPEEIREMIGIPVSYLPTATVPARTAALDQLSEQLTLIGSESSGRTIGLLAAGASARPATVVGTLVADQIRAEGRQADVTRLREVRFGERKGGGTTLATTSGSEAATMGASDLPISLWAVIVHLGQATRKDLDQIRLLFGRQALEEQGIMAIAIPSVDVTFGRRRVKPTRPQ